ncbi:MAG TPA: DUF1800 domain-containing protein [Ignavibacteria bacterium]|nr:DUF1800 domain-containing protein [Ignavibacteria bacterium]
MKDYKKYNHLFLRSGFGIPLDKLNLLINKPIQEITDNLFNDSESFYPVMYNLDTDEYTEKKYRDLSRQERQEKRRKNRQNIQKINTQWLIKMSEDNSALREKMTFFWHGHFACKNNLSKLNELQNNTLRKNALGNFKDLLFDISKDPAMLQFLNNQQNRKKSPNENFARELLELFTLGRGHYTEDDIKNAAKAFTGWGYNDKGEFIFKENQHDNSKKIFMGQEGNFNGDDIINILLRNKRTAEFISEKIYKFFVNENIDTKVVKEMTDLFFESGYDIKKLMKFVFNSDWFYDNKNIGSKVKSPVEYIAGIAKTYNINFVNQNILFGLQRALGQILLNPPNVGGWASGKNWIDTSSLMFRLKLPEAIFSSSDLEFNYKKTSDEDINILPDEELNTKSGKNKIRVLRNMKTNIDIKPYVNYFSEKNETEILNELCDFMLQVELNNDIKNLIYKYSDKSNKENFVESTLVRIMSLPEFQMC